MTLVLFLRSASSATSRFAVLFFLLVNLYYLVKATSNALNDKCMICQFLSRTFLEGLEKTEKLHFGGGNTDWEERRLGKFKTSETRFVEILDYVCKKDSTADPIGYGGVKDFQFKCQSLLETHEELLEQWFFEHQEDGPSLQKFICIEKLKFCCDDGYYGDNCSPCPGMKQSDKPCFGNGRCQGNGTRTGDGTCSCDAGYVGKMCSNCDSFYFAVSKNASYIECEECFDGCSGGCDSASPKDCRSCRNGYKMDPEIGCNDIDECAEDGKCVKANEKCVNTAGSFECQCIDGFKRLDSGECSVEVEAHPSVPWLRPGEKLRLFSYSSLFFITIFVFTIHCSTVTAFLAVSAIFVVLLIDLFFSDGILNLFRHFFLGFFFLFENANLNGSFFVGVICHSPTSCKTDKMRETEDEHDYAETNPEEAEANGELKIDGEKAEQTKDEL